MKLDGVIPTEGQQFVKFYGLYRDFECEPSFNTEKYIMRDGALIISWSLDMFDFAAVNDRLSGVRYSAY